MRSSKGEIHGTLIQIRLLLAGPGPPLFLKQRYIAG
jgi:hypothetical protein